MYNFYLHNKEKEQTFTDFVGTIAIEEARSLDNVWSYINAQTGYNFPVVVLDNPVVPLDILRQMYDPRGGTYPDGQLRSAGRHEAVHHRRRRRAHCYCTTISFQY